MYHAAPLAPFITSLTSIFTMPGASCHVLVLALLTAASDTGLELPPGGFLPLPATSEFSSTGVSGPENTLQPLT